MAAKKARREIAHRWEAHLERLVNRSGPDLPVIDCRRTGFRALVAMVGVVVRYDPIDRVAKERHVSRIRRQALPEQLVWDVPGRHTPALTPPRPPTAGAPGELAGRLFRPGEVVTRIVHRRARVGRGEHVHNRSARRLRN